jgi:hypothetical protein
MPCRALRGGGGRGVIPAGEDLGFTRTTGGPRPEWRVEYMSLIIALADIGPGDGATVLVPGSHKSLLRHPVQVQMLSEGSLVKGAVEMHLRAGDCLLFNDTLCHGAAARLNAGERRILCFRYLPKATSSNRWGYLPSEELMQRLSPCRRAILTERAYVETERSHVPPHRQRQAATHDMVGSCSARL